MICNWIKNYVVALLICSFSLLLQGPAFAKKNISNVPNPEKLMLEAQKEVSAIEQAAVEQLPVEESDKDGYWWNKQDKNEKITYVNALIKSFKLTEKKLSARKIVSQLDIEYNPRDNPLEIKIDKSLERMFNIITKEMILK